MVGADEIGIWRLRASKARDDAEHATNQLDKNNLEEWARYCEWWISEYEAGRWPFAKIAWAEVKDVGK